MCRERHLYVITVKQTDRLHVRVYLSSPVQGQSQEEEGWEGVDGL